jgi:anti-sigma factor ChrR (cupin superfamily)
MQDFRRVWQVFGRPILAEQPGAPRAADRRWRRLRSPARIARPFTRTLAMTAAATALAQDLASRVVHPKDMAWQPTRFPGCYTKPLMVDRKSGLATLLFKMDPGAELPDHEHVLIEQTYVLEGSLADKEGPDAGIEVKAGEFVWRPAGSRHAAWSPNGGTFVAIFQIPNKFYEKDGRVTDSSGKDWDELWGDLLLK